jgi:signal transduction histidine kinase
VREIATTIETRCVEIIGAWLRRTEAWAPRPLPHEILVDSLAEYIQELAAALRAAPCDPETAWAPAPSRIAEEHGLQRLRLGYSIHAIVHEYAALRDSVLDVCAHAGVAVRDRPLAHLLHYLDVTTGDALRHFQAQSEQDHAAALAGEKAVAARARRQYAQAEVALEQAQRAHEALSLSEARNRAVLSSLTEGVMLIDTAGRLELANGSATRLLRLSLDELAGSADPPADWKILREDGSVCPREESPPWRVLATRVAQRDQILGIRRGDDPVAWLSVNAEPVYQADGATLVGVVTSFFDITRDKQRADFEQHLLGIVSHDLRNPVSAVSLSASALLRNRNLDPRLRKTFERIEAAAARAQRLIADLLDFTQARLGGGIPLERREADLHDLVVRAVEEVQLTHPGRQIVLNELGDGKGAWDEDRLAQVVTNLLRNALQHGEPDKPVHLTIDGDDEDVSIRVHNAGAPIPADKLSHIFEPMSRASRDKGQGGRSVGLGLFIVRHIVRAHGGSVDVQSHPSTGTTFTVRLPRLATPADADAPATAHDRREGAGVY